MITTKKEKETETKYNIPTITKQDVKSVITRIINKTGIYQTIEEVETAFDPNSHPYFDLNSCTYIPTPLKYFNIF